MKLVGRTITLKTCQHALQPQKFLPGALLPGGRDSNIFRHILFFSFIFLFFSSAQGGARGTLKRQILAQVVSFALAAR
ncbi:hypothetical protein EJB31_25935 [Klebsiella pneumoniae]|uniref:hypothetical protein n=1 Tax=Klebsiella pneumoniae TaxID=573 RepID=UPI0013E8F787|nr:hypothetical protein [Klebsiella pneumoniae]NGX69049.1 hypothetical protein [Klebsiella pneumoniae]